MRRILSVVAFLAVGTAPALAQSPANAILILDASGSMWGQVEGQTKIAAARGAVDRILTGWRAGDRLGLMAYGHRSKGDCRDIELVVPVGPVDAASFRDAVARLNPRGRTPIAASLREAASILKSSEEKATVILVSDGLETCEPDPCAVAAELKKASIGFTAHVIGFDVADPVARSQLQCIAGATGGVYLDARNAPALEEAMTRTAEAARNAPVASAAPPVPVKVDPLAGRNLRATARLAESSDPLTDPRIAWGLHHPDAEGKAGEHVRSEYGGRLAVEVEPGRYVLKVDLGAVTREFPVTVEPGRPTSLDLVLDAGSVSATGTVPGGSLGESGVSWQVLTPQDESVATEYAATASFVLPAGSYRMKLTKGLASIERPFTLAAGDSINVAAELAVGRLQVDAVYAEKGPPVGRGLVVEIRRPSTDMDGAVKVLATGYDPQSVFHLPAGSYGLLVGSGEARREAKAEIVSGKASRVTVNLEAGVVVLSAPGDTTIEVFDPHVSIEGTRRLIATGYDGRLDTVLPAGAFVAVLGRDGETKSETPFTVNAGQRLELSLR